MRLAVLCSLLLSTAALASPVLELEVGAGAHGWVTDPSPTFSGRVGLDLFDWFTPGVRAMSLTHFKADDRSWALLADLRVHTAPRLVQLNAGVDVGFALAHVNDTETVTTERVSPYLMGDVGVRLNVWRMWVGLNVGASPMGPSWVGMLSVGIAPFGRD
ncbi:MAG: hypothetical protein IPJ65_28020 [Archangiaceae bacterium]|nr:hypothetical protein [Archangiaceae bacterium]